MKKVFGLILILPFVCWAQSDSLELKKDSLIFKEKLNGKIPGLDINSINPVQPQYTFVCRIPSTQQTNRKPLYVIDGEMMPDDYILSFDPDDIESINVLKGNAATSVFSSRGKNGVIVIKTKKYDEQLNEYDLAVLDLGYDGFLKMQPSAGTYSLSYLQNRNQRYVSAWNQSVLTGDPKIYEMPINYDPETYYGLEFEYKLYMFFKFMEQKHSVSIL